MACVTSIAITRDTRRAFLPPLVYIPMFVQRLLALGGKKLIIKVC